MAKPRKEDQDEFERMSDVMKRLVQTPPKPHAPKEEPKRKVKKKRDGNRDKQNGR